jgi:hypothetical protein
MLSPMLSDIQNKGKLNKALGYYGRAIKPHTKDVGKELVDW